METKRGFIRSLPKAVFEAALIIFSVLVALGVDEYRESRGEKKLAQTFSLFSAAIPLPSSATAMATCWPSRVGVMLAEI